MEQNKIEIKQYFKLFEQFEYNFNPQRKIRFDIFNLHNDSE